MQKYAFEKPAYMKSVTQEHSKVTAQFEKRAYKELLEYCSDHMFDKLNQDDPARRQSFKTIYTLEGAMLENLEDLKSYCEEPNYLHKKKHVVLRNSEEDKSTLDNKQEILDP